MLLNYIILYCLQSNEEPGEFSCGWVLLDLYEQTTGALIGNKLVEINIVEFYITPRDQTDF